MGSSLPIRNLADGVKTELRVRVRVRAARNGRSMEEEARLIFAAALAPPPRLASDGLPWSLGEATRMIFGPENGVELDPPRREPMRDPPDFGWVLDGPEEPEAEEGGPAPKPEGWSSSTPTWFRNCCGRSPRLSCWGGPTACRARRSAWRALWKPSCVPVSSAFRTGGASGRPCATSTFASVRR